MKILLIILSIILFVPEVYAIECSLPLCKRMQKQSAEFDKMFNEMRRYTITKTSFVPPVRQKYIKKKKPIYININRFFTILFGIKNIFSNFVPLKVLSTAEIT